MALTKQTALKPFKVRDSKPLNYRQGPQMYTNAHILCSINTFTNVNANVMYVCMYVCIMLRNTRKHMHANKPVCTLTGIQ